MFILTDVDFDQFIFEYEMKIENQINTRYPLLEMGKILYFRQV